VPTKIVFSRKMKLLLLFVCLYYLIPPLTWDYAFAREYDLFAVSLKQSNEFRLPLVESYYTPGVILFPAFVGKAIPFLGMNRIMIIIYSLLPIFMVVLLYIFGEEVLENKQAGFFFAAAYTLTGLSKNAIFGGSAWPSLLSLTFFLASLIFFFVYMKMSDKKALLMSSFMIAGAVLSHIDTAIVMIYGYVALFISYTIIQGKFLSIVKCMMILGIIAGIIISPFIFKSLQNKEKLDSLWTEEAWLEQQKGEAHVKTVSEIMFLVGKMSFILAVLGIIFCVRNIAVQKDVFAVFLILWSLIIITQNTWFFVQASKLFLPYYPLNIIMWMDLAILLSFLGGYGLFFVSTFFSSRFSTRYFTLCCLVLVFFSYLSFETVNAEGIYPDQGGYLKRGLIAKGDYVSRGDIEIIEYLKNQEGIILNNNLIVGTALAAMSEQETYTHIYEESYFDPSKQGFFEERRKDVDEFFEDPISNKSITFIVEKNISSIFLASEQTYSQKNSSYYYNPTLIESGLYSVLMRNDGAKLLILQNSTTTLRHYEAERYTKSNSSVKQYSPPAMAAMTVQMNPSTRIIIPKSEIVKFVNKTTTLYIKYTSFKNNPKITIHNGNNTIFLQKETSKIHFVESNSTFKIEDADIEISTSDNLLFIPVEIDWIELES